MRFGPGHTHFATHPCLDPKRLPSRILARILIFSHLCQSEPHQTT